MSLTPVPTLDMWARPAGQRPRVGEQLDLFATLPRATPGWVARARLRRAWVAQRRVETVGAPDREGGTR